VGLPASALYFRAFAGRWLAAYCQRREAPAAPEADLQATLDACPPMRGSEYLSLPVLARLWLEFGAHVQAQAGAHPKGADAWLQQRLPHWHMVGRVTLHLAENKRDVDRPFAFLATYTSGLSAEGKARHVLLQQAVHEYAGAAERASLLHLLEPISLAAEKSQWLKDQVESGAIYQQQTWLPREALAFLKEVSVFEQSGLAVRIPDWWKAASPPRPSVRVTVGGGRAKTALDAESLLSFQVEVTLDGEPLSPQELKALQTAQGLVLIKGRWVEADAEKLKATLKHWKDAQAMHFSEGVSFQKALRLLSGAGIEAGEAQMLSEEARAWTGFAAGDWLKDVLARLRDPSTLKSSAQEPGLQAELRPYQKTGVSWLYFMNQLGLGACLADDMGLGKTIQVLALLLRLKREAPKGGPTLLVAPASLITNWQAEAKKFAPGLQIVLAHPSGGDAKMTAALAKAEAEGEKPGQQKPALTALTAALKGVDLVVTTYGMVARSEALRSYPFRIAVLDEAQAIKNPTSAQARAVKAIRARSRIVLTGTPVENRLGDLWSLFDFINSGLLGTAPEFSRFAKRLTAQDSVQFAPLRRLVRPYILRRLKTDKSIIADLPDKTEVNVWCQLSKPQAALYQGAVKDLGSKLSDTDGIQKRGLILAALMHLKQICNHPSQVSGDGHYQPSASGKFMRLSELCGSIAERQEKVLVFTQFTELIPALRELLRTIFKRDGLALTGQTPIKQRQALVQDFARDDGPPFFILSLKAGGTGLTLTQASHVIHFDRWWNPAVENQATDRAYRIGQKKNVLVHKFVCRGTLEERIDQLIADKRELADGVLADGNEVSLTNMSDADLLGFVALDIRQVSTEDQA
jgi:superfamily II DNA or RNA helicase